jgi:hypothetical protein
MRKRNGSYVGVHEKQSMIHSQIGVVDQLTAGPWACSFVLQRVT